MINFVEDAASVVRISLTTEFDGCVVVRANDINIFRFCGGRANTKLAHIINSEEQTKLLQQWGILNEQKTLNF